MAAPPAAAGMTTGFSTFGVVSLHTIGSAFPSSPVSSTAQPPAPTTASLPARPTRRWRWQGHVQLPCAAAPGRGPYNRPSAASIYISSVGFHTKYAKRRPNGSAARGQPRRAASPPTRSRASCLGFGRIVVSDIEAPNMLVNPV